MSAGSKRHMDVRTSCDEEDEKRAPKVRGVSLPKDGMIKILKNKVPSEALTMNTTLDISGDYIGDEGTRAIAEALKTNATLLLMGLKR